MKEDFDYKQVPANYCHCLNATCPRASECLRYQVSLHVGANPASFVVANPAYVAGKGGKCPLFQEDRLTRFALGIKHLFDNVPHAKALEIRETLHAHFEHSTYYRIRNKKRLIWPEEQDYILQVFRKKGIQDAPVFDEYTDQYDWNPLP